MKKKKTEVQKVKILPPKVDIVFKMLFGDERNKDILIDFLKSILTLSDDEYENITITDPHLKRERKKDKLGIVDVKLTSKSGKIIHIEIQVLEQEEMPERATYYNAKMLTSQIKSGDEFETLKRTISIIITDFDMMKEDRKYHYIFELIDRDTGTRFTDLVEIHTLELTKIPKESDNTTKYDWLRFLKSEKEEELEMMTGKNPAIDRAVMEVKKLSRSERAQMLYEDREKAIRDRKAQLKFARNKGIKENNIKIIENGFNMGLSIEQISQLTGLTIEEIEKLREN
jgi:predicted transposase/invertase (TIGR01784 family)